VVSNHQFALIKREGKWATIESSERKRALVARARSIVSYLAVRSMGMKTTEVAGLLNLTQPAVSRSLLRGEEILKESEEFDDLLIKL
jgi:predicted transcriptional regulator